MTSKESAEKACKEPNPIIDGRKANVNLAILGAKPRGNAIAGRLEKIKYYSIHSININGDNPQSILLINSRNQKG